MTNCPNCGAPIIAPVCDYCGTRHWGFEEIPGHPASKITQLLECGIVTANEARKMLGIERNKEIQNALKGPYRIKW